MRNSGIQIASIIFWFFLKEEDPYFLPLAKGGQEGFYMEIKDS